MSRSSMRMKNYRPVSADFSKTSLSAVLRLGSDPDQSSDRSSGAPVTLINYKRSVTDEEDPDESSLFKNKNVIKDPKKGNGSSPLKQSPNNGKNSNTKRNSKSYPNRFLPRRLDTSLRTGSSEDSWGSEDDDLRQNPRNSDDVVFESFSCTDDDEIEEDDDDDDDDDEDDLSILESSADRTQDDRSSHASTISTSQRFTKTKSLREKFRDSKTWSIRGRSAEKDVSPPPPSSTSSSSTSAMLPPLPPDATSESRLSRLFSLRRSVSGASSSSSSTTVSSSSMCDNHNGRNSVMPKLPEEEDAEEQMLAGASLPSRRSQPPTLSSAPPDLTQEQLKRRHIISTLVHSENNYVASLQRLVNEYKKPLEESNPPIVNSNKIGILFHRVPEILQCHLIFRIALSEAIRNWDNEEKIGDVFVASFSKAVVLEYYSDFINNFNAAMDCAKSESKRKSAMADFLQVKQITAHDRVSFFGLMVKPVQRFPQFILILQDLLKETPRGHSDRMALQLALTTLESLAEMLNERKREAEQYAAFKEKIRNMSGKTKNLLEKDRFLLKEDDVTQLEFNGAGLITRSKQRRLLLVNDYLLCVSVQGRTSEADFNNPSSSNSSSSNNERLSLKWAVPVADVEVIDGTAGGTLARLLAPGSISGKRSSLGRNVAPSSMYSSINAGTLGSGGGSLISSGALGGSSYFNIGGASSKDENGQAENLAQDMNDLMHDFDVVSRISSLLGTLKGKYDGLTTDVTNSILTEIQRSIRQKDEEMSWVDACCLQLAVRGRSSKEKPETFTFQTRDPNVKKEWIVELRLAQLALDINNSPAWDVLEQERNVSTKMPLYVRSLPVYHEPKQLTEVSCGCSYTLMVMSPTRALRPQTYVWANATNGTSSQLRIFGIHHHHLGLKELGTISLNFCVKTINFVPGLNGGVSGSVDDPLKSDLVWVGGALNKTIIIYSAFDPDRGTEIARTTVPMDIVCISYHCEAVWVGLSNGYLAVFRRNGLSGIWDLNNPSMISLSFEDESITSLLPVQNGLYVSWGKRVSLIDAYTNEQLRSFKVQPRNEPANSSGSIQYMAQSGVGLWIALRNSSTICLYHTETFRHLQDINIASNVSRVLAARDVSQPQRSIHVTAMMASRGLLWVGTNVGIALTVPLPRLEGVPIISGRANISYHAHFGAVTFFLNLSNKVINPNPGGSSHPPHFQPHDHVIHEEEEISSSSRDHREEEEEDDVENQRKLSLKKQHSEGSILSNNTKIKCARQSSSPAIQRRRKDNNRRASKTLPRGFSLANNPPPGGFNECDVFGLYGELFNVRNYDVDSGEIVRQSETELRRSDPELSTLPYRVSTLDRRVKMKTSRPRSLDMSSWSVESRGSSGQTTSSSEAGSERPSPNVSRNASFQSSSSSSSSGTCSVCTTSSSSSGAKNLPSSNNNSCSNNNSHTEIPKLDAPKTIMTLMGGRGYINWRQTTVEKNKSTASLAQINNSDAFLVIWEMKL